MISAHTPPGTKVVCIDDKIHQNTKYFAWGEGLDGLTAGETYTVGRIQLDDWMIAGYEVVLVEITRTYSDVKKFLGEHPNIKYHKPEGFCPSRFRRAELPSVLTDILKSDPVLIEKELELVE